jgi:hypothetical protein
VPAKNRNASRTEPQGAISSPQTTVFVAVQDENRKTCKMIPAESRLTLCHVVKPVGKAASNADLLSNSDPARLA